MKMITGLAALLLLAAPASAQQVTRIPAADKTLAGAPTQQFAIGAEDGEDWELLSRVSGVAFDTRDNLYVLDAGNNRVLVFDARGKFVRKIGKKGGGPGELMSPVGLALTKDGFIAVTDLGRPGVSLFKTDGSFVKNLMLGDSVGFPAIQNGTLAHPTAGVVIRGAGLRMAPRLQGSPTQLGAPTGPRSSPILWLPANGAPKNLYSIPLPSLTPKVTDNSGGNGTRNVTVRISQPAFQPPVLWGLLPNGTVAVADEAGYKVKLISNGKVTRVVERGFAPRKATEADKDRARAERRAAMKSGRGMMVTRADGPGGGRSSIGTGGGGQISAQEIEQNIREMTFLDIVPHLQRLSVDPRGRLWIERTARNVGEPGPIDIVSAEGNYLGTINGRMPDAISATGRAAYIERDDMDVEKVVVRTLPKAWL